MIKNSFSNYFGNLSRRVRDHFLVLTMNYGDQCSVLSTPVRSRNWLVIDSSATLFKIEEALKKTEEYP